MNTNRQLLWGIILSLLAHGAVFGLPFSPVGQRPILTHRPLSLEISLVKAKAKEDTPPKKPGAQIESPKFRKRVRTEEKRVAKPEMKPAPKAKPERVRKQLKVKGKKVTETRKREKSSPVAENKPIPSPREIPVTPPVAEIPPTPKPEPVPPSPQRKTAAAAPESLEKVAEKAPATPVEKREEGDELRASLSPEKEDSPGSRLITMARPRYDRNPKPPYPRIARRKGYEGLVLLKVEILPNGRVGEIRVKKSSGHAMLDRSALKTVRKWRFIPAKRRGEPIRIWAEVPIKFDLK